MNAPLERIRACVVSIETWTPPSDRGAVFQYVDISSVDREEKRVIGATALAVKDAPSRARQRLKAHDVLVSTVRPNLNAVAMVPGDLDGAVGSTGFTVLRANPKRLLPRYLYHWVRTPVFIADMVKKATGASYPAVSDRIVLDSEIPVLPLAEQHRVADILDKADAIRRKRTDAIALTQELRRSFFLEMFGDPVANPREWPVRSVSDVCESKQYGTAEKANTEKRGLPVLRMNNVTYQGDIDISDLKWVELPTREAEKLDLRDGDVLFNRVNSHELVGKTAVWHGGAGYTFAGYLIRLRIRSAIATGDYVSAAMNMPPIKQKLMGMAKPSINMANISGSDLDRLLLPFPPLAEQRRYSAVCRTLAQLRRRYADAVTLGEQLQSSLASRAFSAGCSRRSHADVS